MITEEKKSVVATNEVMERLEEVCRERRRNPKDFFLHEVNNDNFKTLGIERGTYLIVDEVAPPQIGDYTFLYYRGERQLVLLSGKDFSGRPILCRKCVSFPYVFSTTIKIILKGTGIAVIRNNTLKYL